MIKKTWTWLLFLILTPVLALAENQKIKLSPTNTTITILGNVLTDFALALQSRPMVDPKIDQIETVFSYFSKPVYHIGVPGEHFATMVTPEGRLYNGSAELVFFKKDLKPISQRIYTLLDGWLPCIQYQVEEQGVVYKIEAFQFWLEEENKGAPVNFVRVSVKNLNSSPIMAGLAVGYKFGGLDHRPPQMRQKRFNPGWSYGFGENYALRDGKLVYYFDQAPTRKWIFEGRRYRGRDFKILENWRVNSIVEYELELGPEEEKSLFFKFPQYLVEPSSESLSKLANADFIDYLNQMVRFWSLAVNQGMTIGLSEPKVVNASRSALVHNIMCQEYPSENEIKQVVNRFQYNRFWLRDSSFHSRLYTIFGHLDSAEKLLRHFLRYQDESGNFLSQKGQLDGFGQSLWAFGEYIKITRDREFAQEILPSVKKAISWFEKVTKEDKYGLLPSTFAMDNEWIIGRYTGHNIWALAGLDGAIEVAKIAGDDESKEKWKQLRKEFYQNFYGLLAQASERNRGRMPPGMDVPGGVDWGNLLEVYPDNFLPPDHPLVEKTFEHYRKKHYAEGIATYQFSMHHYITERVAKIAVIQGRQEQALSDFYSMLLHTGSCHQGFEWAIYPWSDRDYCPTTPWGQFCNFPPHGWYAVFYNTLLRNMLIREQGNELHLLSALSPEWTKPGEEIQVNRALTYFGIVSLKAKSEKDKLALNLKADFTQAPEKIVVHFPFFARVEKALADTQEVKFYQGYAEFGPETKMVEIFWRLSPAPEYSYQAFVERYKKQYQEKYRVKYR